MIPTTHAKRPAPAGAAPSPRSTRTTARLVWLVLAVGSLVAAGGMAATAAVVHQLDDSHRDGGYLTTDTTQVSSTGHAVVFEEVDLDGLDGDWLLGTARVRVTSTDREPPVFIGVASAADVKNYLRGVGYSTVSDIDDGEVTYAQHAGASPTVAPDDSDIWTAYGHGAGTQTVTWKPEDGSWAVVVMNQDASSGVQVQADVGASVPIISRLVRWLVIGSAVSAFFALAIVVLPATYRRRVEGRR